VGLQPLDPAGKLLSGAHLYREGDEATRPNDQGYVTSVAHSPTLGHMVGLGFLRRGMAREGETIRMVDGLRGETTLCKVVNPVFFDPEGGRVRG
ncbi:glycine cleavage T C-terminal barrel domain-containing protein, partial [Cribrihabitans sp. XS_ASV171]